MNKAQQKIDRIKAALSHKEGDRVPVSDFFLDRVCAKMQTKGGGF